MKKNGLKIFASKVVLTLSRIAEFILDYSFLILLCILIVAVAFLLLRSGAYLLAEAILEILGG